MVKIRNNCKFISDSITFTKKIGGRGGGGRKFTSLFTKFTTIRLSFYYQMRLNDLLRAGEMLSQGTRMYCTFPFLLASRACISREMQPPLIDSQAWPVTPSCATESQLQMRIATRNCRQRQSFRETSNRLKETGRFCSIFAFSSLARPVNRFSFTSGVLPKKTCSERTSCKNLFLIHLNVYSNARGYPKNISSYMIRKLNFII
ncbi:hypothetical protein PUN28_018322 [Cardiocondyla obscurior]|uniref:Uncharacterized protein n=1 Tax=Cardiocondyla obscurior TaxID=286306 RepID=A0AAW2EM68_9HYME